MRTFPDNFSHQLCEGRGKKGRKWILSPQLCSRSQLCTSSLLFHCHFTQISLTSSIRRASRFFFPSSPYPIFWVMFPMILEVSSHWKQICWFLFRLLRPKALVRNTFERLRFRHAILHHGHKIFIANHQIMSQILCLWKVTVISWRPSGLPESTGA